MTASQIILTCGIIGLIRPCISTGLNPDYELSIIVLRWLCMLAFKSLDIAFRNAILFRISRLSKLQAIPNWVSLCSVKAEIAVTFVVILSFRL